MTPFRAYTLLSQLHDLRAVLNKTRSSHSVHRFRSLFFIGFDTMIRNLYIQSFSFVFSSQSFQGWLSDQLHCYNKFTAKELKKKHNYEAHKNTIISHTKCSCLIPLNSTEFIIRDLWLKIDTTIPSRPQYNNSTPHSNQIYEKTLLERISHSQLRFNKLHNNRNAYLRR